MRPPIGSGSTLCPDAPRRRHQPPKRQRTIRAVTPRKADLRCARPSDRCHSRPPHAELDHAFPGFQDARRLHRLRHVPDFANQTSPQSFTANHLDVVIHSCNLTHLHLSVRIALSTPVNSHDRRAHSTRSARRAVRSPSRFRPIRIWIPTALCMFTRKRSTNERADQPDFVIDLGDTFMTDNISPTPPPNRNIWRSAII